MNHHKFPLGQQFFNLSFHLYILHHLKTSPRSASGAAPLLNAGEGRNGKPATAARSFLLRARTHSLLCLQETVAEKRHQRSRKEKWRKSHWKLKHNGRQSPPFPCIHPGVPPKSRVDNRVLPPVVNSLDGSDPKQPPANQEPE